MKATRNKRKAHRKAKIEAAAEGQLEKVLLRKIYVAESTWKYFAGLAKSLGVSPKLIAGKSLDQLVRSIETERMKQAAEDLIEVEHPLKGVDAVETASGSIVMLPEGVGEKEDSGGI